MRCLRPALLLLLLLPVVARADDLAARVVILANSAAPGSMEIARHYAAARGVPAANIIAMDMPTDETITWQQFLTGIWKPLEQVLVSRNWIEAVPGGGVDALGRSKLITAGQNMSYLVVCRGVPLRINNDPALQQAEAAGRPALPSQFNTNQSCVDSELSLLAAGGYVINGFVQNPLFQVDDAPDYLQETVVKVARLDGPTVADVLALIDRTIEAEQQGLIGRAYVDVKGPHAEGEQWLEQVARMVGRLGYASTVNREAGTFPATARCDAPALYFGWYAPNLNGPFALPGFRFAPGAIAVHIYSYSAATLRSATSGWCGPLIARGACATTGAVFEPYLQFMHRPQLLLRALARGDNLGDAAYYALPVLSWQNVLIGDPLYRPFKRPPAEQWRHRKNLPQNLAPYVTLREMQLEMAAGQAARAIALARGEQRRQPSLAVGLALAHLLVAQGDKPAAARAIGFAPWLKPASSNEWELLVEAADLLAECGEPKAALETFQQLLAVNDLPLAVRRPWLREAIRTASAAGDMAKAAKWQQALNQLPVESAG